MILQLLLRNILGNVQVCNHLPSQCPLNGLEGNMDKKQKLGDCLHYKCLPLSSPLCRVEDKVVNYHQLVIDQKMLIIKPITNYANKNKMSANARS